jgi:beta-glucosidase-like glycosyl hydrolase
MPYVTFSEFASRRQVTRAAVTAATKLRIKEAIVIRQGRRMLDLDMAMQLWDQNTKRNGAEKLSATARSRDKRGLGYPPDMPSSDQLRGVIMGLPEDQIPGLDVSRERKEHYNAEIARLQALKEREELVPTADVKREAFALGRQIRDNVLGIPDRVSPLLAAAQDSREVHRLLSEELRTALRVLADG